MYILIDADGCPVVPLAAEAAAKYNLRCLVFSDTAHEFHIPGTENIKCSVGADSVDLRIANSLSAGDIVITQDYGLATLCLARGAFVLDQNGMEYTDDNIDSLLFARHMAKKDRSSGLRLKGPSKRNKAQDDNFKLTLYRLISKNTEQDA